MAELVQFQIETTKILKCELDSENRKTGKPEQEKTGRKTRVIYVLPRMARKIRS
jgi:hypothetical protein